MLGLAVAGGGDDPGGPIDCALSDSEVDFATAWHSSDSGQHGGRQHFLVPLATDKGVVLWLETSSAPLIEDLVAMVFTTTGGVLTLGTPYVVFPTGSEASGQEVATGIVAAPLVPAGGGEYVVVATGVNNSTYFVLEVDGLSISDRSATIVQNSSQLPGLIQPISDDMSVAVGYGSLGYKRLDHSSLPDITLSDEGTMGGAGNISNNIQGWAYIGGADPCVLFMAGTSPASLRSIYDLAGVVPDASAAVLMAYAANAVRRLSPMARFRQAPNGDVAVLFAANYAQVTLVSGQPSSVSSNDDASDGEFADATGPSISVLNGDYRGTVVTRDTDLSADTAGYGFVIDPDAITATGAGDGSPSAEVDVAFNNTVRSCQMIDVGNGRSVVSHISNATDTISLYLLSTEPFFPTDGPSGLRLHLPMR